MKTRVTEMDYFSWFGIHDPGYDLCSAKIDMGKECIGNRFDQRYSRSRTNENDCVSLTNRKIYARFVKTVIMKPFLERLPNDEIRNRFLELFLHEVENRNNNNMGPQTIWSLDYVRLNIISDKP